MVSSQYHSILKVKKMFQVTKRPSDSGKVPKVVKRKKEVVPKMEQKKKMKVIYGCNKCDEVFNCKSKQRNHLSNSHGNKKTLVKDFEHCYSVNQEKTKYTCNLCLGPHTLSTANGMATHLGSFHKLVDKLVEKQVCPPH